MKGDILKKFVDENRDEFDDQLPDPDILAQLQARLGIQPIAAAPKPAKLVKLGYWWAAAAVIAVIIGTTMVLQQNTTTAPTLANTKDNEAPSRATPAKNEYLKHSPSIKTAMAAAEPTQAIVKQPIRQALTQTHFKAHRKSETKSIPHEADDWQADLENESSSIRLAAVLASGKNKNLSDNELKTLYNILNNDENSNVRLAALEVLKKRERAGKLILSSVNQQDDPVIQMELLASLSPTQALKVAPQLLGITQNPLTIDAVRNEAYAVLLKTNTNF